jgi:hypothetical protein
MDTDSPAETAHTETVSSLWARACEWLSRWSAVFSPEEILRDGLSRRLALRCCAWLAPLEAAVRRLIIAAALAFDPTQLPPASPTAPVAPRKRASLRKADGRTGFRIFCLRPSQASPGPPSLPRRQATPLRHLPFPGDDLLRLGPSGPLRQRPPSLRQPHPLIRQCRIFHYDPDYIARERCSGPPRPGDREAIARPAPNAADRCLPNRRYAKAPGEEWRRVDMEWQRILPAPGLAARITALIRAVENPQPLVRRVVRRLIDDPALAGMLRGLPAPRMRRPAYDRLGSQVDEDLLPLCHSALDPPDTS